MKTLQQLNDKVWYRLLKVIYIFWYGLFLIMFVSGAIFGLTSSFLESLTYLILGPVGTIAVFEVIKRLFYYIMLGKLIPPYK